MRHIISLGAGVQSSTMALMAAHGEIEPMPECAIFADTGDEPEAVYVWLSWLQKKLPFPVHVVEAPRLSESLLTLRTSKTSGNTYLKPMIPAFSWRDGKQGMMRRQCTSTNKIDPIVRKVRALAKEWKEKSLTVWLGISIDEASRMKPSRYPVMKNIWPLIEADISREDCIRWMDSKGYRSPPRSACWHCPYHNEKEWLNLKRNHPQDFLKAVEFERRLQRVFEESTALKGDKIRLHRSGKWLSEVEFDGSDSGQIDMFINECEGMCGV